MDNHARPLLGRALLISLALHASVLYLLMQLDAPKQRPVRSDLTVRLPEPPPVPAAPVAPEPTPRLQLSPEPQRNASAVPTSTLRTPRETPDLAATPAPVSPQRLTGDAAMRAAEQLVRDLPYPPEAIERGLQGEALVLLFLDKTGNVIAARLEASSGHALLDEAAVRAARQLRSLPDSAPREALLPVRFRLR